MTKSTEFKLKLRTRLKGARKELSETASTLMSVNGFAVVTIAKGATGFMFGIATSSIAIGIVAMGFALTYYRLRRANVITALKIELKAS